MGAKPVSGRVTRDVIGELFSEMRRLVQDYGEVVASSDTADSMIQGTAAFPGGAGLWRGAGAGGVLPEVFPHRPMMLIGHNFDSERGYRASLQRGVERLNSPFWSHLRAYISESRIPIERYFFTNALMGLQPIFATGRMPTSKLFKEQCREFLQTQIRVVRPRCIAVLGSISRSEISELTLGIPCAHLVHPSSLVYKKKNDREPIIASEGEKLAALWRGSAINPKQDLNDCKSRGVI